MAGVQKPKNLGLDLVSEPITRSYMMAPVGGIDNTPDQKQTKIIETILPEIINRIKIQPNLEFQAFIQRLIDAVNNVSLAGLVSCKSYTVATLPSASDKGAGKLVYVSDETGGAVIAFSDGTNWRRVTDRTIVS